MEGYANPLMTFLQVRGAQEDRNMRQQALNTQRQHADIQNLGALSQLADRNEALNQRRMMQDALRESGGDIEAAIPKLIQTGNIGALTHLAPMVKELRAAKQAKDLSDKLSQVWGNGGGAAPAPNAPAPSGFNFMQANDEAMGNPQAPPAPQTQQQQMSDADRLITQARIHAQMGDTQGAKRLFDAAAAMRQRYHVVQGNLVPEPTGGAPVAPVYTAPQKPEAPKTVTFGLGGNVVGNFQYDPEQKVSGKRHPTDPRYVLMGTHQGVGNTNVNMRQESAESATVGKAFGEQFNEIQKDALESTAKIAKYDRLSNLLTGIETGKLTPTITSVNAVADSLGIKIDPKLGAKQAAQALASEIALTLRNPSGGAGMPGAMSDKDREFLVGMTPNIANTPEGNKLIIETAKKIAQRSQQVAKMAREYRKKHGHINEGFYEELAQYSNANPMFPQVAGAAQTAPQSTQSGATVSNW